MGKKTKIKFLRNQMAVKIEQVDCLLDKIIYSTDSEREKLILAGIASEEIKIMDKLNRKIYKHL